MSEPAALVGIYRSRNAEHVRRLVEPAHSLGFTVAWWALDEVVEDLAEWTVGSGPGAKLLLLNEIVHRIDLRDGWLVVSDDDVVFVRGDVVELVSLSRRARLDLARPARADAAVDHEITVAHRLSRVRRCVHEELAARGFQWWADVQKTLATWRSWQRSPRWASGARSTR